MKYSNTALKELTKRYKNILIKCAMINAIALMVSIPAMADINVTEFTNAYNSVYTGFYNDGTLDTIVKTDENITLDASKMDPSGKVLRGVMTKVGTSATKGGSIELGGENTESISIISKQQAVLALGNGSNTNPIHSSIQLMAKNIYLESTQATANDTAAVHVGNNTDAADLSQKPTTTVTLKGDNITIKSNRTGVAAMSQGLLNITGNTSITGGTSAIVARGYATVNINTTGSASTKINGDISLDYSDSTSRSAIDAYVNLTLNGSDSYWTGNTSRSWDVKPADEILFVNNGVKLTLNDGAVWNATKISQTGSLEQISVNNLIVNNGTINVQDGAVAAVKKTTVNGNLTLNGKITGETVEFKNGSSLTTALDDTVKIDAQTVTIGDASLNLILDPSVTAKTYNFIESDNISGAFKIADNGLYSFKQEGGKIVATEKSSAEIAQDTGTTGQNADALLAIIDANKTNGKGGALANALSNAMQTGNADQAVQAAKEAAPTDSQFIAGIAKETANTLANVSLVRMDSIKGTSGGDIKEGAGIWGQGLYNHTKQDATTRSDGFSANSRGFALGADKELSDTVLFGMGYAFMNTDADSLGRDIKVNSHNIFAYGKYQPSQWYICSILNYNISKYKEKKAPMGVLLRSEYDVSSYGGQLMTGYVFKNGIRPYAGLRYIFVDADSYYDGIQRVHAEKEDVLTSLVGIKYSTSVKANNIMIRPTARIAATYDILSENSQSNISVMGGSNYQMDGTRLHRFGIETVIGATATIDNIDITLEYNGAFRQDYRSQGGILRARYNF